MEKILELNLIKSKIDNIQTRRLYSRYTRILLLLAVFFFLGFTINFISLIKKISVLNVKLSGLETSIASQRKAFALDDTEKQWRKYHAELKAVDSIVKTRNAWSVKLKECANLLPQGMCIARASAAIEKDKKTLVVEILTLPNEQKGFKDIENFINALENSKYIGKGVKLESHERRQFRGKEIEAFKLVLPNG